MWKETTKTHILDGPISEKLYANCMLVYGCTLPKYLTNPTYIVEYEPLQVTKDLNYEERPIRILVQEVRSALHTRDTTVVKVLY